MAEQWVDAATAFRLVAESTTPPSLADEALCRRAEAGLVKTRAQVLVLSGRRSEEVSLPATFWSAAHLEQDWAVGDFSGETGPLGRDYWQAVGVTFALDSVLEMLPFERRSTNARRLSVAGNPAWIRARDAIALVGNGSGSTRGSAAILEQARLGFVAGRAVLAQRFAQARTTMLLWEEREWSIPNWFWQSCATLPSSFQDWELGRLKGEVPGTDQDDWMQLSGVHFLSESLQVLFSTNEDVRPANALVPKNSAQGKGGGRLPQTWWDDMWCDVWGLIHQGDFEPRTQADVERAMLTWAIKHDHPLAEATARLKARKLFQTYSGEATNFLAS